MDQTPETNSPFKGKTGLTRIINAAGYSKDGFIAAFEEQGFRQLFYLSCVLIPIALLLDFAPIHKLLMVLASLATLTIELFNTAIEAAVDHTSLERHPLAKRAKDTGSAAQIMGLTCLAIIWLFALFTDKPWMSWF